MTWMRDATKKQLDLQEILFSKMVVRSEFVLQQHLQQAVQAAAADLEKANITPAEATALLDYDKREVMPSNSLLYKVDKYDKVSRPEHSCSPLLWHTWGKYAQASCSLSQFSLDRLHRALL